MKWNKAPRRAKRTKKGSDLGVSTFVQIGMQWKIVPRGKKEAQISFFLTLMIKISICDAP